MSDDVKDVTSETQQRRRSAKCLEQSAEDSSMTSGAFVLTYNPEIFLAA